MRTLPYAWYADPAVLRLEQERIFARTWQYAARADQVSEPGSLIPAWAGSLPVVLARGSDGALRGFVNVCRHRGHVLCETEARRETIQCPYHAWTYDLDGTLRSAPRAAREGAFDPASLSLVPVSVDVWGPFVFVNPDPSAAPLADALGGLPRLLAEGGVDVDGLRFHSRAESDEYSCNWKVCAENFLECYHCAVAHPSFAQAVDVSPDAYGLRHEGTLLSQFGPPRGKEGGGVGYDTEGPVGRGQFHFLFPGTVVNVMPGRQNLSIGPLLARGPERTARYLDYFVGTDADDEWLRGFLELDERVGAEDRVLVEAVQRGIGSGALEAGVLLPESEQLIARFQALVLEALGD
ncbi:MAG TPA: aromatic ring-hydroxylating dioxygenase subunit alpha [Gaiellaceae bacterium]|jgi:choline monooxygenase